MTRELRRLVIRSRERDGRDVSGRGEPAYAECQCQVHQVAGVRSGINVRQAEHMAKLMLNDGQQVNPIIGRPARSRLKLRRLGSGLELGVIGGRGSINQPTPRVRGRERSAISSYPNSDEG